MSKKVIQAWFEQFYAESDFLNTENDEREVRKQLDVIESKITQQEAEHVSLLLYPNIKIVWCFMEKWNVTPIMEGKKWLVLFGSGPDEKELLMDLDAYDDAFAWCRLCNRSFEYFSTVFGSKTELKYDDYQYPFFIVDNAKDPKSTGSEIYLKSLDTKTLIDELKTRSLSKTELDSLSKLLSN
jgi:hypothetical protein